MANAVNIALFISNLLLILVSRGESKVPAIIVFGDSSVDSGNNNQISTVLKSNFQPYGRDFYGGNPTGRFSNGRIPPDFISEAFGLKPAIPAYLDPKYSISDFATGVCFASAGTGFDNVTSDFLNVIPLWKELEYYQEYQNKLKSYAGDAKANEIISESLYLVSLGTNDFLENYYTLPTQRSKFPDVKQFQGYLSSLAANFIRKLYSLGARKISFTGLPPMGCLPLERAANIMNQNECVSEFNQVALDFNVMLKKMVSKLNGELRGISLVFSNPNGIFRQIIKRPSMYGFEVASMACCGTGMFEMGYLCNQRNPFTCQDASKFVFWDAFHPTEKANYIISQHIVPKLLRTFS